MDILYEIDKWLFTLINTTWQNSFFDSLMSFMTEFKNWKIPIISFLFLYFLWVYLSPLTRGETLDKGLEDLSRAMKKGTIFIVMVIVGLGMGEYLNHQLFKSIVARIRPCHELTGIHLLAPCNNSFSFPSSHAVNVVALAVIMSYMYKRFAPIIITIAVLVSYSRVYLGVHYPFDVVAGNLFGAACAFGVIYLKIRITCWLRDRERQGPFPQGGAEIPDRSTEQGPS